MAISPIVEITEETLKALVAEQEDTKGNSLYSEADGQEATYLESHITFDDENLSKLCDQKEFVQGVTSALEIAGFYTTLVNFGVAVEFAELMIKERFIATEESKLTKAVLEYQMQLAKDSADLQKTLMKERSAHIESGQI